MSIKMHRFRRTSSLEYLFHGKNKFKQKKNKNQSDSVNNMNNIIFPQYANYNILPLRFLLGPFLLLA